MSHDLSTEKLAERYGTLARPARRRRVVVASGLLGVVALAWVVWAAWLQGTPQVQSSLHAFEVIDTHSVRADVTVKTHAPDVAASCLVRAYGEDHSVVGELNFKLSGSAGARTRRLLVRTERKATSVEMVGCTAPGQRRPR